MELMSALPSGILTRMPNSLAIIGRDAWDERSDAGCANSGGRMGQSLPAATRARGGPFGLLEAGKAWAGMTRQILASRVILIATPDDVNRGWLQQGNCRGISAKKSCRGRVVLHTSGAMDSWCGSRPCKRGDATVGSMHPLQSFSGVAVPSLEGQVFTIEGGNACGPSGRGRSREALGGSPVLIAGSRKSCTHAAAAMADGHVLALAEAAMQLLLSLGMSRSEAVRALLPLTRQVLAEFRNV